MKVFFIPGLLCTPDVWGTLNNIRYKYESYDADVVNFDSIKGMSDALINTLPSGDIAIIGISMGGYVALDTALKLGDRLTKLVLINTTSHPVNQTTLPERKKAMQLAEQGALYKVMALSRGICYYQPKAEWLSLEEQMAQTIGATAYLQQQHAIITRQNYSDLIKNITAKTLIIAGKNDQVIPYQDSIFMAEQIKNSKLLLLNECGHLATLEKGQLVVEGVESFFRE